MIDHLFSKPPWPHQRAGVEQTIKALTNGTGYPCLTAPTGCHAKGQGILLHSGHIRPVEDIQVGGQLMGPDGQPKRVLSLSRGTDDLYQITPTKGNPWIVNLDHILTLVRTVDKTTYAGKTIDVSLREWLGWSKWRKHIHKLFRTSVDFPEQEHPGQRCLAFYDAPALDPYFLGIVLGDGSLTTGCLGVTTADDEIVKYLQQIADYHGLALRAEPAGGTSTTYYLVGERGRFSGRGNRTRNPAYGLFRKYGLAKHNSGSKFIPHAFRTASRRDRLLLLAGLMDTDGSLTGANGYDYISKSRELSEGVAFVARSVGLAAYVTECEKRDQNGHGGTYWRVSISGDCCIVPCRIPRKRAKPRRQKKDVCRTGFTVTPAGHGDYFGFTLDGDGRYLLDDFTVTHNSGKTLMQIALARWQAEDLGGRVLCLTNRILLTEQTRGVFQDAGIGVGVISSSMKWAERDDAPIQIATIQTLLARRRADPGYWVDADLLLIDEVHQCSTGSGADLINEYKQRGTKGCGVTATPLGVCDVCDELIVAARTRDLQDQGILCYAKWFAPSELDTRKYVKGKVDLSLTESEARKTWGPLKGDDAIRTRIVGNILEHYQRIHPEQTHTLAFAPGVKESLWAAQFCLSRGIRALHVDGTDFWVDGKLYDRKQGEQEFQAAMQEWRDGAIPILWNRFVLREGIDEPQIKCILLATPIGSYRSFLQMVGRGLRTHESKDTCIVIDYGGAWWRHGSVNVNVDWESVFDCSDPDVISKNRIAEQREKGEPMGKVCPKCGMVHKALTRFLVCQYCGHQLAIGKPSRPILQADGTLTQVSGEPVKQWKIRRTPEAEKLWNGLYWGAVKKHKGDVTPNELYARFAYKTAVMAGSKEKPAFWKAYYPPRTLPLMPKHQNDWHRLVKNTPKENLY